MLRLVANWPMSNIVQFFTRIGAQHTSIFTMIDLLSGTVASCKKCNHCVRNVRRCVPIYMTFGPKRVPSYFQEQIASVVLTGLIYNICEIYLDDCIVYATSNEQSLGRLEAIFVKDSRRKTYFSNIKSVYR
jgi:hypothetical protein